MHVLLHNHLLPCRTMLRGGGQMVNVVFLDHVHRNIVPDDYAFAAAQNDDCGKYYDESGFHGRAPCDIAVDTVPQCTEAR
jgi:hypothetical protein